MNRMVVILMLGCLSLSCVMENCGMDEITVGELDDETYTFHIEQQKPECASRSMFSRNETEVLNDINIFVYHQGSLLEKYCRYVENLSSVQMTFPGDKDGFNIYMLGNVGKLDAPDNENEIKDLIYVIDSYEDLKVKGFPVANAFNGYRKGGQTTFLVKRLLGQYNLSIRQSAQDIIYTVKDVKLVNCARDICPFGDDRKAELFVSEEDGRTGDMLTQEDVAALNAGETVELYFVENLQGVLLPDNTDSKKKIPSSLPDGEADRCTYIEITADMETQMAQYTDGKYRYYLGQDQTTDFSIRRNTVYSAVLDFTQNMVCEEEWRIEVATPRVGAIILDKEEAMVIDGAYDQINAEVFDVDGCSAVLEQTFDVKVISDAMNVDCVLDGNTLRFYSFAGINGVYPYGSEPEYIVDTVRLSSKETYNGKPLITKDIKVRVYDRLFPLLIRLERPTSDLPYTVIVKGWNPMKLGLAVESMYTTYYGHEGKTEEYLYSGTKNGYLVDMAVDTAGRRAGELYEDMLCTDLRRIDFVVRGLGEDYDVTEMTFPKLLNSKPLFTGENTEATYGPFEDLYPTKCKDLPNDGKFVMEYVDNDRNTVVLYGPGSPETGALVELTDWTKTRVYNPDNQDVYFYTDPEGMGVGKSKFVPHADYCGCPFYVVNGGLTVNYFEAMLDKTLVEYPEKNSSHFKVLLYGSGRDLFVENRTGEMIDNTHWMYYKVSRWKEQSGYVRVVQDANYYLGLLYMTVNGASSWTGCDETEYGYFTY